LAGIWHEECQAFWGSGSRLKLCVLLAAEPDLKVGAPCMGCPVGGSSLPENIFHIESCAAFYEQVYELVVSGEGGLMQRRGMGVEAHWVVAIRVFAGVEQRLNNLNVAELRCEGESAVAIVGRCERKQSTKVLSAA